MCVIIVGIIPPYKFQWWVLGRNMRGSSIHSYRNCQGQFDRRFGSSFQIGSAEQYSAQEFKTFIMEQSELPIRATLATPPTSRFLVEKSWAPQPPSRYWWLGVLHQPSCLDHSSIYYECTRSKPKAERNNTDEAKDLSFWFFFFFLSIWFLSMPYFSTRLVTIYRVYRHLRVSHENPLLGRRDKVSETGIARLFRGLREN